MPLPEKFWIEQFKKAGLLAPERDGIIKEAVQAAGSTALQVGRGIGSTIEEVTGEPAIRQYFQEREAAKPHWRPDPNYSPSSLHPADVARTVSTGVTQSVLSLGAGIVGGAVGGAPGALAATTAGVFAHTYGDRVKEYREAMPDADDGVIKGWAFLSALGESLIETVAGPEQMVAGMFKGVARQALSQTTKQLIKTIGKEAAKSALAEGSEEVCQMYWDNLVRLMAGQNVELQPFEEVRDTFMAGALPGAFMGGVGSGIQQSGGVIDPRQHLDPALQVVQGLSEQLKVPIRFMTEAEVQQNAKTDENGNPVSVNGYYDTAKSEIVLNPNGELSIEQAFGHELKHFLNVHHPDLVEVFDAMAQQNLTEQGQQELADTEALYGQLGDARTEFNAEWFARLAMEPDALREAAIIAENQKVGFGEKLINAITEFLKMVMDTVRKIGTPEMEAVFNNAKEVRAEAIKLLSDFNRRQHSQLVPVEQTPVKSERKLLPMGKPLAEQTPVKSERKLLPMGKPLVEQPPEERTRQKKLLEESQARSELEQLLKERQERRKVREDFLKHQEAMRKIDRHLKRFGKFADEAMSNEAFRRANAEELNRIEDAIRKGNPQLVREGLDRLSKRVRNWNKKNRRTSAGSDESQLEVENQAKSGNKAETKAEKLFFSKKLVFIQPEQDRQTAKPAPPVSEAKKRKSSIVPEKKLPFVVPVEESQVRSELEQLLKERQERRKVREDFLKHQEAMRKIDKHLAKFNKFGSDAMDDEAFRRANTEEIDRIEAAIRKVNPQLVREGLDRLAKRVRNWKKKNKRADADSKPVSVSTKTETESGSKPEPNRNQTGNEPKPNQAANRNQTGNEPETKRADAGSKTVSVVEPKKLPFVAPEAQAPTTQDVVTTTPNVVPAKKLPFVAPQAEPVETTVEAAPGGVVRVNTNEIHVDPKRFQFKSGTNPITGVDESNKVGGEWDPKSAGLVYVWEDKDGKKFIVNGHHRLQLAKELNVPMLNAIVDREVDGVSQEEARRQGVLTNIRDGQGRVEDYATFVRGDKSMDEAAARKEGITSRAAGRQGFMIGRYAGEELYGAFKAGDITGAKAAAIAEAGKGDPATQIAGMKKAKDMSAEQLREFLKILQLQQRQQKIEQLDLFGFDDSAIKMSEDISRLAIKKLRAIRERILTVRRAVAKPDVAQQGDVKVGKDAQKLLDEALQEQARWEHYETDRELYQQLMEEAGYGKKEEAPAKPEPVKSEPSKPLNPDNPLGLDGFDDMLTLFSESEKDTQKADQATARAEARAAEISKFNAIAKTPELDFEGAQQQQQQGQKPARPEQKQEPAQQTPEQKPEQKQQQEAESMQESQQKPETPPPPKGFVWTSSEAAQKLAEHKESQESKQPQAQARQESEFTLEPYPQTGEQKWVVKKKSGFANRQQFDLLHNQAKTLQGIYNKFAQGFLFDSEEDAKRFMERQSRGNVLYSLSRESKKFSLSRQHQQVNPILKDGKIRDEYRSWLENGRYTPQQVGEWHDKALRWIARQGGVLKAANEFADGTAPAGKIGAMAARLIMNSQEFAGFDEVLRKAVADQYIFQGTEWGREGVARRLASLNLDTIEKAQVFFDRLAAKMEKADREKMRKDVHDRTGVDIFNLPPDIVNDPAKLDEVLRAALASSATMQSKVREYWINAILSGPQTHAANMVGNFANMMYELGPKRLAEAMINLAARRKAGATVGEFKAMVSAFDWRSAWQRAKAAFDQEVLSPNGKVENTGVAIKGKHGRIIRLPGRLLKAADEFAKAIIAPVEAAAYAYREAMSKGLSESDAKDYIQRQLANKDSEANQFGATRAIELTFQEDPGAAVQHLVALREKGGIIGTFLQYFLPFIKTPTNLLRQGVRKSPLGVANLAGETFKLLRGKRQLDSDYISLVAEQLLAWGAVAMFLGMGDDDDDRPILTGTGAGMSLNERRFKGGIVPSYSIRIGDKYYSYRRLEPLSTGLALIADGMAAYRAAKHGKAATAAIKDMMHGATMLIAEKSYLNSLDQIHQFITDPERGIEQWGTSFLASWIPNVTRQTVNTMDSNLRDYRSRARGNDWWKEQFFHTAGKAGLVRVAPMVDYFGREVKKYDAENSSPGADLWRLVSPIAVKPSPDMDKADLLLWNYNHANPDTAYWPGLPSYTFQRNRERFYFSGEDYADFAAESGKLAHKQINNAIRRGLLNVSKPTNKDIDLIKRIFTRARRETRDKFFAKKRYDRASFE